MKKFTLIDKTTGEGTSAGHKSDMIVGTGRKNFDFPSVEDLVRKSLEQAQLESDGDQASKTESPDDLNIVIRELTGEIRVIDLRDLLGIEPLKIIPDTDESGLTSTLLEGADALQELMGLRQFEGIIEQRFGALEDTYDWAIRYMPEKFQPAAESLNNQLVTLKDRYGQALPSVVSQLAEQNPDVPLPRLLEHAIQLLDQQLQQILFILNIYAEAFRQRRNRRRKKELNAVAFFYEEAFKLLVELLGTDTMKVGDVFLTRFSSMGLSTIPGAKGPVGAHLLQVPYNMQDVIMLMLNLLAHEFRHNFFADIDGMEEELTQSVFDDISAAVESGELPLASETIKLGETELPAADLLAKMTVDSIGEIDADIAGGILFTGTSYGYGMIATFPAMMITSSRVSEATKLLRTSSYYELIEQEDGSHAIRFEPHPPDYIRVHINAAALDEIGFTAEADQLRELADFAVGTVPEFITWDFAGNADAPTIKIPVADIKAAAPIIARTLIRKELKSLGGRSTFEIVNWTQEREDTVQALAKQIMSGKTTIPEDVGTVYATYIGAAAMIAFWTMIKEKGIDGVTAAKRANSRAMSMLVNLQGSKTE